MGAAALSAGPGALTFIDTQNAAAPGTDENSSADMGRIIEAAKALQRLIGGLVVLVHHTGKDATKGLRGHSSLLAALDAAIEVTRDEDRREWRLAKSKDGKDGEAHPFRLEVVQLGQDDEGEPVTSCVVRVDTAGDDIRRAKVPQGGNQRLVYEGIRGLFKDGITRQARSATAAPINRTRGRSDSRRCPADVFHGQANFASPRGNNGPCGAWCFGLERGLAMDCVTRRNSPKTPKTANPDAEILPLLYRGGEEIGGTADFGNGMQASAKDGRLFEHIRCDPYSRRDGTQTLLSIWQSACAVCGAPFSVSTPRFISTSKAFDRKHCDAHKLRRLTR